MIIPDSSGFSYDCRDNFNHGRPRKQVEQKFIGKVSDEIETKSYLSTDNPIFSTNQRFHGSSKIICQDSRWGDQPWADDPALGFAVVVKLALWLENSGKAFLHVKNNCGMDWKSIVCLSPNYTLLWFRHSFPLDPFRPLGIQPSIFPQADKSPDVF